MRDSTVPVDQPNTQKKFSALQATQATTGTVSSGASALSGPGFGTRLAVTYFPAPSPHSNTTRQYVMKNLIGVGGEGIQNAKVEPAPTSHNRPTQLKEKTGAHLCPLLRAFVQNEGVQHGAMLPQ